MRSRNWAEGNTDSQYSSTVKNLNITMCTAKHCIEPHLLVPPPRVPNFLSIGRSSPCGDSAKLMKKPQKADAKQQMLREVKTMSIISAAGGHPYLVRFRESFSLESGKMCAIGHPSLPMLHHDIEPRYGAMAHGFLPPRLCARFVVCSQTLHHHGLLRLVRPAASH